jgi:trans-aconitate methyltransferase
MQTPFDTSTCSAPPERAERMRDIVVEHAPRGRAIRLLDVGCGNGTLAFHLANALPLASIVGVDISPANIRAAAARQPMEPSGSRVAFERVDYLLYATPPVDVIVTDTVLHFIGGEPAALWTKLAGDLNHGGVLVCAMAYDCAHNRALRAMRRALRLLRSDVVDAGLAAVARVAYGRRMEDALLRERTEYMYIPPEQLMTPWVRDQLAPSVGLRPAVDLDMPGASATQLRQRVTVFHKD